MIELKSDKLVFTFPEVHPHARLSIDFQRTLRLPDDGKSYPLPPGLGRFPLCHVDDHAERVPECWLEHGGVMLPMYQSEAMWLFFNGEYISDRETSYPFAIKVATGRIDAVTGQEWQDGLSTRPQDYMVAPEQPWLDGYCVEKGLIRQFVAMPLGSGYSTEEQLTGKADTGGLQLVVYPMKKEVFERRFPKRKKLRRVRDDSFLELACCSPDMGLAPGGLMKQKIYEDPFGINDWDTQHGSRCFVHITNSLVWQALTGRQPPLPPLTSKAYTNAGLPWFEYYDENAEALEGSQTLNTVKSVATMGAEKSGVPLPENESVSPDNIVSLRRGLTKDQVRELVVRRKT